MIFVVSLFIFLICLVDMCYEVKFIMVDVIEEEVEEDGIKGIEDEGILDVLNDKFVFFYKVIFFDRVFKWLELFIILEFMIECKIKFFNI